MSQQNLRAAIYARVSCVDQHVEPSRRPAPVRRTPGLDRNRVRRPAFQARRIVAQVSTSCSPTRAAASSTWSFAGGWTGSGGTSATSYCCWRSFTRSGSPWYRLPRGSTLRQPLDGSKCTSSRQSRSSNVLAFRRGYEPVWLVPGPKAFGLGDHGGKSTRSSSPAWQDYRSAKPQDVSASRALPSSVWWPENLPNRPSETGAKLAGLIRPRGGPKIRRLYCASAAITPASIE